MSENRFITILTILVFVLSGFIGWHLLSPKGGDRELSINKPASILGTNSNQIGLEPGTVKTISTRSVTSIIIAPDRNRVAYYEKGSGVAFEVGLNGSSEKALSSSRLPNFLSTIWSPNKKEVVSEFAAPGNSKYFSYYNYTTKKSSRLTSGIKSVAFSPNGDRIAYYREEVDGLYGVFISAPDGSAPQKILATRITNAKMFWPTQETLGLMSTDDSRISSLFLISMDGKVSKLVSDKAGLLVAWQVDGTRALASYLDSDGKTILSVVDIKRDEQNILPVGASANECAWSSSESVVCRVAEDNNEPPRAGGLYDINTKSGSVDYVQGSDSVTNSLGEILVDPTNSYILFTSPTGGKLFSLKRR